MNPLIYKCPVCGENLTITHLFCSHCRTTIEGKFSLPSTPFGNLSVDQLQFLLVFIRCEGKFNRMEEELKLSYPTLRSRFNYILYIMGYEVEANEDQPVISAHDRKNILDDLNSGKISAGEAQTRLQGSSKKVEK